MNKILNDPIHGYINLSDYLLKFIDTHEFQRLRYLKQLGCINYIFPGASHSRFEHSLGVCHLAEKWLTKLKNDQPELEITNKDIKLVSLAGLCHDLGHGCFCHAFEHWVKYVKPELNWKHEEMSIKMVNFIIDKYSIDIEQQDIRFVENLILGKRKNNFDKLFLFDIVSNDRNSIDVDKFDYLIRDAQFTGFKANYDYARLINFSKVISNEICFYYKEAYNIYEMFHVRYLLHKQIYNHKVSKAIEFMVKDALILADPVLKIFDSIDKPQEFSSLNDNILYLISSSNDNNLYQSKKLIERIESRNLYKCANEILIPFEKIENAKQQLFTEKNIVTNSNLTMDDFILTDVTLNYAMKEKNPIDNVHFYDKFGDQKKKILKKDVSLLIPENFSEYYVRIYVKDKSKFEMAHDVFNKLIKVL